MLGMALKPMDQQTADELNPFTGMAAAPVDPHASLTAPISPAPVTMSRNELGDSMGRTNELGDSLPERAEDSPMMAAKPTGKMADQESHLGSRLGSDYAKDDAPAKGFFGHLMNGIDKYLPGVAEQFRGTKDWREKNEEPNLEGRIQKIGQEESTEGLQSAETGKDIADTGKTEADTQEVAPNAASQRDYQASETAKNNDAVANPSLATAYAHAVNQALKENRDPSQDPIVQHLSDAITSLQPGENKTPEAPKTIQIEQGGKPHQMAWDAKTGKYDLDQGESGEKPPSVNVNAGAALGREEKNDALKAFQPSLDSAERLNVMTESYEKAVKDHDQQAMLNLLANHLGMTMGLQKGARMTRDIINEAKNSTPWLQGMEAKFDKDGYLTGVTLTPQQMRQMVSLGQERYAEDTKKARSTAQYLGVKDDGPDRVPGKATINYYLGQANGDPAKAKSLAAADGWTIR
jgi:hypothetical protein